MADCVCEGWGCRRCTPQPDAGEQGFTADEKELFALRNRVRELEAFKTYVHKRLDDAGVPTNPEPAANAEHGCRVEGRLNFLIEQRDLVSQGEDRAELVGLARGFAVAAVIDVSRKWGWRPPEHSAQYGRTPTTLVDWLDRQLGKAARHG